MSSLVTFDGTTSCFFLLYYLFTSHGIKFSIFIEFNASFSLMLLSIQIFLLGPRTGV
jgi:hypothetical protein